MKINNRKVNLLIVESGGGHGGSASYLLSFLKYLNKEVFNPTVVLYKFSNTDKINKIIDELKINVVFLDYQKRDTVDKRKSEHPFMKIKLAKYFLLLLSLVRAQGPTVIKLLRITKEKKIDAILINSEVIFNMSAVIAAKISNIPCIVRKSGGVPIEGGQMIKKFLSFFVDAFVASSDAELKAHIENKFPYIKLITVYEGVDLDLFYPAPLNHKIRDELDIKGGQHIVGNISRIDYGKGHSDFIKAAALVLKNEPNTLFLIVGDGFGFEEEKLKKSLYELSERLGIDKNVIFLGWREDIFDILQGIDIFVHCPNTWKEGMGIATLEAIACGKPTIITDNWGLAETTKDNFNGFVVPIGDFSIIAKKIEMLIKNPILRQGMCKNARVQAENKFDIRKNVSRIEKIIFETIEHEN